MTEVGKTSGSDYDTHHIVLDFGSMPFPVLEGQSIGIIPPGADAAGKPHHARQYSIASPRNGERPGYNNLSLTIKRVLEDHQGRPVRGVASNYLCDLQVGDAVRLGDCELRFPGVVMTPDGLQINQANVINTLNVAGGSITSLDPHFFNAAPNSSASWIEAALSRSG